MAFPTTAAACFCCELAAFVPAAPPLTSVGFPRQSPRRMRRRGLPPLLPVVQLDGGDQGEDEDIPNLFRVTPVPTHEEMLAWAEETDRRIAAGRLPPFGTRPPPSGTATTTTTTTTSTAGATGVEQRRLGVEGGDLLSREEAAQMETLSGLLSKRRREGGSALSVEDEASLRAAIAGLSASVDGPDDDGFEDATSAPPDSDRGGVEVAAGDESEPDGFVRNQIYGSREVRDKVYLYAWSLMKNRQEMAEREEAHREEEEAEENELRR